MIDFKALRELTKRAFDASNNEMKTQYGDTWEDADNKALYDIRDAYIKGYKVGWISRGNAKT